MPRQFPYRRVSTPQPQPGFADSVKIGSFQIFLTQMDAVRPVLNGQPPVVVDKQTSVVASSQRDGGDNVGLNFFIALILDAQLEVRTPASSRRWIHSTLSTTG